MTHSTQDDQFLLPLPYDPTTGAVLLKLTSALGSALNTAVTTVGAGTLSAAALYGRIITRSGSAAAYTDTTDTATAIVAAVAGAVAGQSWEVTIKNTVAFPETIAAGAGVTLSGQTIVPPNSVGRFLLTLTNVGTPAVSLQGLAVVPLTTSPPLAIGTLSTVGAGTILAATIAGGIVQRTGSQSNTNFTDTTDTAALIIAALPNANAGQSYEWTYENTTNAVATIVAGSSVTVSGIAVVPPGTWARYAVTVATSSTVTIAGFASGPNVAQQPPTRTTAATGAVTNATSTIGSGVLSDLTVELSAGQKVSGHMVLFANNSTAGEGIKIDLGGGTATWTSIQFGLAGTPCGGTVGVVTSTAIATALTITTVSTSDAAYTIAFAGVVNAAGTLIPRAAENSSHTSGTVTVQINSYLRLNTSGN